MTGDRVYVAKVVDSSKAFPRTAPFISPGEAEIEVQGLAVGLSLFDRLTPCGKTP